MGAIPEASKKASTATANRELSLVPYTGSYDLLNPPYVSRDSMRGTQPGVSGEHKQGSPKAHHAVAATAAVHDAEQSTMDQVLSQASDVVSQLVCFACLHV